MRPRYWLQLCASLLCASNVSAQEATDQDVLESRIEQHRDDFDYLLGDWEFTATDGEYGTYGGYWSALRLACLTLAAIPGQRESGMRARPSLMSARFSPSSGATSAMVPMLARSA